MTEAPFVLILGMHRSGTSCLAGCLEACGLFLGEVSRLGRFNAKGNRESKTIWKLHDQILALNKGTWHAPPESVDVHPAFEGRVKEHIASLKRDGRSAGVKDPRTVLILDYWRQLTGNDCRVVGTFRHPIAVAQSLARRDGMSTRQALDLWVRYNTELVRHHKASSFPLVEYDLADSERYVSSVCNVARSVGLNALSNNVREFVAPTLQHHESEKRYIPDVCRSLYKYLKENVIHDVPDRPFNHRPAWLRTSALAARNMFLQATHLPPNSEFEAP